MDPEMQSYFNNIKWALVLLVLFSIGNCVQGSEIREKVGKIETHLVIGKYRY